MWRIKADRNPQNYLIAKLYNEEKLQKTSMY